MTSIEEIKKAFKEYTNSELYKKIDMYRKLSDGKTVDVFANAVIKRVKMEYMGAINDRGDYSVFNFNSNGITTTKGGNVADLVCSYGILNATTRLYSEYATSKPLIINSETEIDIDIDDILARLMIIQSWAGKVLLKSVVLDNKYTMYPVTPRDYFTIKNIFNPFIVDKYIIYNLTDKAMKCEIYSEKEVEYRQYVIENNEIVKEVEYDVPLELQKDGLGYKAVKNKWAVVEVQNIFGKSDYNDDLIKNVREVVIGDTLTSQAFQKVANPLLQVPDSLIEIDSNGRAVVRIDDRVVALRQGDREVKQVQLETKTLEWKEHRKQIVDDIYKMLGVNDLAFGISIDGAVASGEAKIRSLERMLSTVSSKRDKCIAGITKLIKNIHFELHKKELNISIKAQDILTMTTIEKINLLSLALQNNLISLENAVKFLGIYNDDLKNEIQDIKNNINYKKKVLELLQQLESISRDERIQKVTENMTEELIKELIANEE